MHILAISCFNILKSIFATLIYLKEFFLRELSITALHICERQRRLFTVAKSSGIIWGSRSVS